MKNLLKIKKVETPQLEITKQKSKESIPQTDDIDTELDANFGKLLEKRKV